MVDQRLQSVLGREVFTALLSVILEEKKSLIGLEWELVDLAQHIYSLYVLGMYVPDRFMAII